MIKILLENKKKTFTQYRMVYCIFSKCMNDTVTSADLIGDGMIQISRWCSGERPIPKNVLEKYEENDYWNDMEEDFRTKIIPNLINELQVRSQLESLLDESIDVIGADKIQEMKQISDNAGQFPLILSVLTPTKPINTLNQLPLILSVHHFYHGNFLYFTTFYKNLHFPLCLILFPLASEKISLMVQKFFPLTFLIFPCVNTYPFCI